MRARNIFLAILIVIGGMAVTAYYKGIFTQWKQSAYEWRDYLGEMDEFFSDMRYTGDWKEVARGERKASAQGIQSLSVQNPNGQVVIKGKNGDHVLIKVIRYGRGETAAITRENAQLAQLQMEKSSGTLAVLVTGPPHFQRHSRLDLEISIPSHLKVRVKTASGGIDIQKTKEGVSAVSASGGIIVREAGRVQATSASGSIQLSQTTGNASANTVSGGVILEQGSGKNISLHTVSGQIHATFLKPFTNKLSANSVSGAIDVGLPAKSDCAVEMKSVSGEFAVNVPLQNKTLEKKHLSGVLGSGRGKINIQTVSGDIRLDKISQ